MTVSEGLVKQCDMLKHVGLNKSPRLDGLPYKVYLHIIVTILIDVFNHWFAQGVNPGSISRRVST